MKHLAYGLRTAPEDKPAVWGARLIYPNDLVWDRQDLIGNDDAAITRLTAWLNGGPLRWTLERLANIGAHYEGGLSPSENREIVLYEDETGIVKGNPQGSHGYLYVAAWLKHV